MSEINVDSPSVQSYLGLLQGIINRMAANSCACKTWCIAIVSAIVVIVADEDRAELIWISLLPVVLLSVLDAYYLGLERQFRGLYNSFIRKIHTDKVAVDDVFVVSLDNGAKDTLGKTLRACGSITIWPFYGLLALMLIVVRFWILSTPAASHFITR